MDAYAAALAGLAALGAVALLQRELVKVLLGLAILAKSATLSLVLAGVRWGEPERGQALAFLAIALDAAVTAMGLALFVHLRRRGVHA